MRRSLLDAPAIGLALLAAAVTPACADSAFPSSITTYPYPPIASPSKYPVTVIGCGVARNGRRLRVGFSFKNIELDPMTSVKISVDLYDPFHAYLATLDSTIDGTYAPNAVIQVSEFPAPGNPMPLFSAYDAWPSAASAVCYVSGVVYGDGTVWTASARPSFDVASHALDAMRATDPHKAVAADLAGQKALGDRAVAITPSPLRIPDGWKTVTSGMYLDAHPPALHILTYVALSGPGGRGPLKPTAIPAARTMDGLEVTDRHAITICGNRPAEYLSLRGTSTTGPQIVDAIKVEAHGRSYVASYARSFDAPPNSQAEDALANLCF